MSRNMAAVRSQGSKAELLLRKRLWRAGYRYRVCRRDLPGKPDIVFGRDRIAVFVDGDFWHARILVEQGAATFRASFRTPRVDWWVAKLTRNAERDAEVSDRLRRAGWVVVRLWERDILRDPDRCAARVARLISAVRKKAVSPATAASTPTPSRRPSSAASRVRSAAAAHARASALRATGTRRRRRP